MEHSAHAAGRGRGRGRGHHFFPPCIHCGRPNHVSKRCWQKYGRPNNARAAAVNSNPHISADNSSAAVSEPPSEANIMLPKIDYVHLQQQQNFHAVPSTSGSVSVVSHGSSWIIDSGASSHMSGNRSLFSSLRLSSSLPPVSVADGSPSPVHGIGTVRISSTLTLSNVLYVPQFPVNLLSASRLARDYNCSLTFFPSYCVFQDLRTRAMIGGGCETGGLYYLTDRPSAFVAKIDMGANLLGANVNISPKLKVTVESCHTYYDIGSCEELPMAEETVRGMKDSDMSNNFVKADVKSVKKLPFSNRSTLMKPTASQLAKQNHAMSIRNTGRIIHRLQKPTLQNSGKSCKGTLDGVSQASKRQKLEGSRTRKVHDMKQHVLLVHKIPQKKEEHNDHNPSLPKLKLTIPREPELGTARRARRIMPGGKAVMEKKGASTTAAYTFRARPLNRKILEAPTLPLRKKSTPRPPEFQEFHLKTSERAIQHASASSASQVQNHMPSSHPQDVDTGNRGRQPHSSDLPFTHTLHANDNHLREEGKKEVHKFKARPLNKKILSAKGDIGVFRSNKREVTKPLVFNFKTDKRCQQNLPIELFNKLSLTSDHQSSTSEASVSSPVHGAKENISEQRQQDHKAIHVSMAEQRDGRRQLNCDQEVVSASFRAYPHPCRSLGIR